MIKRLSKDIVYLREFREAYNLTQKEFAEIFGIAKSTVEAWERGAQNMPEVWYFLMHALRTLEQASPGRPASGPVQGLLEDLHRYADHCRAGRNA